MKKTMKKILALVMALACVMSIACVSAFAAAPADGTYTVPVHLWKADKDEDSMAAPVLGATATVTVSNGQITMTVNTPEDAKVMGLSSKLSGLQVADASGNYVDTAKNGNNFTFTVTQDQWDKGVINAKESASIAGVPESLTASMSNREVRIKVDTDKLTQSAAAQTTDATTGASSNPLTKVFSQLTSIFSK